MSFETMGADPCVLSDGNVGFRTEKPTFFGQAENELLKTH